MPSFDLPSQTSVDTPPFPSPSLFSILPEIYLLISRIELLQQATGTSVPTTPGGNSATTPITLQELPAAIQPVRTQIIKAKVAVQALPDVERTIEQQEDEIRLLEGRVGALKKRLRELGRLAGEAVERKDVVMTGVEE